MNSYKRPRSRPRRDSISFRSLGWLLVRRAYLQLLDDQPDSPDHTYIRRAIRDQGTDRLRIMAARFIELHPERRFTR